MGRPSWRAKMLLPPPSAVPDGPGPAVAGPPGAGADADATAGPPPGVAAGVRERAPSEPDPSTTRVLGGPRPPVRPVMGIPLLVMMYATGQSARPEAAEAFQR